MQPPGVRIHKDEVEEIWDYIKENKPVVYEELLHKWPKAMFIVPILEQVKGIEHDDVIVEDEETADAMNVLIAEKFGIVYPGKRSPGMPG